MKNDTELKTNADRIRNMTNDELAEFLCKVNDAAFANCKLIDRMCKYFSEDTEDKNICNRCFNEWVNSKIETKGVIKN